MTVSISGYGAIYLSGEDIDANLVLAFVHLLDGVGSFHSYRERSFPERVVLSWEWRVGTDDMTEWRERAGSVVERSDVNGFL